MINKIEYCLLLQSSILFKYWFQEIRDVIRQITASVTFLPLLDCPCTFDVLIHTERLSFKKEQNMWCSIQIDPVSNCIKFSKKGPRSTQRVGRKRCLYYWKFRGGQTEILLNKYPQVDVPKIYFFENTVAIWIWNFLGWKLQWATKPTFDFADNKPLHNEKDK